MDEQKPARERMMERMGHFLDTWAIPGSEAAMLKDLAEITTAAADMGASAAIEGALQGIDSGMAKALEKWKAKYASGAD